MSRSLLLGIAGDSTRTDVGSSATRRSVSAARLRGNELERALVGPVVTRRDRAAPDVRPRRVRSDHSRNPSRTGVCFGALGRPLAATEATDAATGTARGGLTEEARA